MEGELAAGLTRCLSPAGSVNKRREKRSRGEKKIDLKLVFLLHQNILFSQNAAIENSSNVNTATLVSATGEALP